MTTLLVKQSLPSGATKTWKLRPSHEAQTFGSSRLAKLISISDKSAGIEAVFEFKNGQWYYHDLGVKTPDLDSSPSVCVNKVTTLQHGESTLQFTPVMKDFDIMERLENLGVGVQGGKTYQLFIVKNGARVVDVKILAPGKKYKSIPSMPSQTWVHQTLGDLKIQQRTVQLDNMEALGHFNPKEMIDPNSKRETYAVLGASALVMLAILFGPSPKHHEVVAPMPKVAQKVIVKTDIKMKKQKQVAAKQAPTPPTPTPPAAQPAGGGSGGRVANMVKSLSGGRISQLLGKVSSQAAKSANVIVTNGVKAGTGASGRALAGIGNVERSGRDWGSESGGKDVTVSTVGRGGGRNASGMGGLAAGSTGSAGVGLIEEEGEITGGLDREVIAQYIKTQLGQILYCYERQLSANPDLFGKVAVKFTIGASGAVEKQLIGDTTLKNATVEGCILNRVAAWKFPTPQGGTKVLVTYPFLFKSTN